MKRAKVRACAVVLAATFAGCGEASTYESGRSFESSPVTTLDQPISPVDADVSVERLTPQTVPVVYFEGQSNQGILQIYADDIPLLTGCGFGFIGSLDGVDDYDNITTCNNTAGENNMRPFNNGPARLPFQLQLTASTEPATVDFSGQVGPSNRYVTALSAPMDARLDICTDFRYSSDPGTWRKYTDNPYTYEVPEGQIFVYAEAREQKWGEILCGKFVLRYTVTVERALFFVHHFATNNVEFSFGDMLPQTIEYIAGSISVRYASSDELLLNA